MKRILKLLPIALLLLFTIGCTKKAEVRCTIVAPTPKPRSPTLAVVGGGTEQPPHRFHINYVECVLANTTWDRIGSKIADKVSDPARVKKSLQFREVRVEVTDLESRAELVFFAEGNRSDDVAFAIRSALEEARPLKPAYRVTIGE